VSSLLLWKAEARARGGKLLFPDVISRDTGIERQEPGITMSDRQVWRNIVNAICSRQRSTDDNDDDDNDDDSLFLSTAFVDCVFRSRLTERIL